MNHFDDPTYVPEDLAEEVQEKRKRRVKRNISSYIENSLCWGWFKVVGSCCKPRLYAVQEKNGVYSLVVFSVGKKVACPCFVIEQSKEVVDLQARMEQTGHELVGAVMRPKKKK